MTHTKTLRLVSTVIAAGLLSLAAVAPAAAGNFQSKGHGVKCGFVVDYSNPLTDPATGTTT